MTDRRPAAPRGPWLSRAFRLRPAAGLVAALLALIAPAAARADLIVEVGTSTAQAGGIGTIDVNLINTGNSGVTFDVSAFGLEVGVASGAGISFTGADTNTALPYIFGTLQFPPFVQLLTQIDLVVADAVVSDPFFVPVNPGETFGLAHITYTVAADTAAGVIPVLLMPTQSTSVSDVNGGLIPTTLVNGSITVTAAAVPEPSSLLMATLGGGATLAAAMKRRSRARAD